MEGGHRHFDEAGVGMRRWLKLVLDGRSQHQQRQHGRLAFGGMVAGKCRVKAIARASHGALVAMVHMRSAQRHVPQWHICHRRHGAGAEQEAVVGAGERRKDDQPDYDRCRNQAASEVSCCSSN